MAQYPPPQPPPSYSPPPQKQPGIGTGVKIGLGIIIAFCMVTGGCFACYFVMLNRNLNKTQTGESPGSSSSSSSRTSSSATSNIARIGQRVESGGIALTVEKTSTAKTVGPFQKADAGYVYQLVEVLIENVSRDKAPVNVYYFKLKDSYSREYSATITATKNHLSTADLVQGEKVRGYVSFEVPERVTGLTLTYEPLVFFGGYEPIRVTLETSTSASARNTAPTIEELVAEEDTPEHRMLLTSQNLRGRIAGNEAASKAMKKGGGSSTLEGPDKTIMKVRAPVGGREFYESFLDGFVGEDRSLTTFSNQGLTHIMVTDGKSQVILNLRTGERKFYD